MTCPCVASPDGESPPVPDRSCGVCNGTGESHLEPDLYVSGLGEADARCLVFGPDAIRLLEVAVAKNVWRYGADLVAAEKVLKDAKGG